MSDLLSAAAQALGIPEPLVQRSAEARAAETGVDVEEILSAWAGGEAPSAPAEQTEAESEPAATEVEETPEPEEKAEEPEAPEPPQPAEPPVETPVPAATPAPARSPVPAEVTLAEAADLPVVVTVPTAGIKERTNFVIPRWLTAVLVVVPLFALFALGSAATGECGEATELTAHVVTGEIVNCDGSEFTGSAIGGGGGSDFVALGQAIYTGGEISGVNCAGCHGAEGQGAGSFPALTGVVNTFGSCADHIEWVALGSAGFQAEGRSTYGDTGKAVDGGMPGFASNLTEEQLAAVVAFERVRFSGDDPDQVLIDCGLVEEETAEEDGEGDAEEGDAEDNGAEEGDAEDNGAEDPSADEATEASAGRSG